jgi:GNAT superfamily N-acetyltransferase
VAQVRRQQAAGYELVRLLQSDRVVAVAGYRIGESLAWGRHMYVDDLVTDAGVRSSGLGQALLDWLRQRASAAGCGQLHLDSGVQRHDAHRFYLRNRMAITSHHFTLVLAPPAAA